MLLTSAPRPLSSSAPRPDSNTSLHRRSCVISQFPNKGIERAVNVFRLYPFCLRARIPPRLTQPSPLSAHNALLQQSGGFFFFFLFFHTQGLEQHRASPCLRCSQSESIVIGQPAASASECQGCSVCKMAGAARSLAGGALESFSASRNGFRTAIGEAAAAPRDSLAAPWLLGPCMCRPCYTVTKRRVRSAAFNYPSAE